jgi:hypothetical protein
MKHRIGAGRMSWVALGLWVCAVAGAADRPLLLLDLPTEGPVSAAVKASHTALQADYDIWWLKVHEATERSRLPVAMVLGSGSQLLTEPSFKVLDFVRQGGGMVFVAAGAPEVRKATNDFLRSFGVRIALATGQKRNIEVLPHAVTRDVKGLPGGSWRIGLVADGFEPLVLLDGSPVAVAGMVGQGRAVVILQPLVTVANPARAPESAQAQLLTQAIAWAAGQGGAPPGTASGPGEADTRPPVAADLTQKALVDLPATPAWQGIASVISSQLQTAQLPVEELAYATGRRTLAETLPGHPALVVIGSHRLIEDAELPVLAEYVSGGGSLLALGYESPEKGAIQFLAALNKALGEFGVTFTEGRPAGQGVLKRHPITEGLSKPGRLGPGGAVWAYADWPLVTVSDAAVASAVEFRQGRIVVMDAAALLPPGPKQEANSYEWFRELLHGALGWLTGR